MTKYILKVIFLFLKNKSWTLGDGNLNPLKGEGVQVPPIWEGFETLRFQIPFSKTSNQTYEKEIPFSFFIPNTPLTYYPLLLRMDRKHNKNLPRGKPRDKQ